MVKKIFVKEGSSTSFLLPASSQVLSASDLHTLHARYDIQVVCYQLCHGTHAWVRKYPTGTTGGGRDHGRQGVFLLMAKGKDLEREGISKVKLVEKGYMFPSVVPTLPGTALDTWITSWIQQDPTSRLQFDPWLFGT